jgi:hypothetical protein
MPYRFATKPRDYSTYAGGHVFYSLPNHPALPVRLASETFQRCLAIRRAQQQTGPCRIYDPCCGGAYHLATLAYLHWNEIAALIASDVDPDAVSLADRNLSLLTLEGLKRRERELAALHKAYGKESHRAAVASAGELHHQLCLHLQAHPIQTRVFCADAMDADALAAQMQGVQVDLVLTDLPYGRQTAWRLDTALEAGAAPAWHLLDALRAVLSPGSLVALIAAKQQALRHEQYRRLEAFRLGKRQVAILQL